MIRILIIEDDKLSADRIKRLINEVDDTIMIDGPLNNIEKVVGTLQSGSNYDIIFSDIRLRDGLVFDAFNEVAPPCPVVFTTAYEEYALTAFKNNGIDYIMKPIKTQDVAFAIDKYRKLSFHKEENTRSMEKVAKDLKCFRKRILVSRGEELIPLQIDDISFIKADDGYVDAYTFHGERLHLQYSINDMENMLNPDTFFRLNRQYLANIAAIRKISYFFSSKLKVKLHDCDDDNIIVSRDRSALFKNWLNR